MYSRRELMRALGTLPFIPRLRAQPGALDLRHRLLGRTGSWVVPLGLGGQASLQWTGEDIDAPDIVVRAFELGVNYFDTANAYGPSQANYGEAFRRLNLDQAARERIFVASKTGNRYAFNPAAPNAATALSDLRRSLTTLFGDGSGYIPEGAYLDSFQIHNLTTLQQVDQIYEGVADRGSKMPDRIGALAALMDYRDGTDYTGLNPERRRWIRHIGITGHQSSPVLMSAIQRDRWDMIDTVLIGMNANDRRCACHQNNVLPLAVARGLGVIVMKVFADGAFYGKPARFSNNPGDVVLSVGQSGGIACSDLIHYVESLPGVSTVITGIGKVDRQNPENDQLVANLSASLDSDVASPAALRSIEDTLASLHPPAANYFNERRENLTQPSGVSAELDSGRMIVRWSNAFAAAEPIRSYEIYEGDRQLLSIPYRPQLTTEPLTAWLPAGELQGGAIRVVAAV
ncbi:MAG: aldo/keto reductase [Bryobacteraceae bacterium]|nr:aldo/keto reductase [Bryobacteraceae bacterium]